MCGDTEIERQEFNKDFFTVGKKVRIVSKIRSSDNYNKEGIIISMQEDKRYFKSSTEKRIAVLIDGRKKVATVSQSEIKKL